MCEHAYKSIALGCIMDSHYDTLHCNEIATYAQSVCQFWKCFDYHIQCILSSVKIWLDTLNWNTYANLLTLLIIIKNIWRNRTFKIDKPLYISICLFSRTDTYFFNRTNTFSLFYSVLSLLNQQMDWALVI